MSNRPRGGHRSAGQPHGRRNGHRRWHGANTGADARPALPVGDGPHQGDGYGQGALDLHVKAAGATSGYIMDASKNIIAASTENARVMTEALPKRLQPSFDAAMTGKPGRDFAFDSDGSGRSYVSSMPIPSDKGTVAGVAILSKSLDGLEDDLTRFGRPYFSSIQTASWSSAIAATCCSSSCGRSLMARKRTGAATPMARRSPDDGNRADRIGMDNV